MQEALGRGGVRERIHGAIVKKKEQAGDGEDSWTCSGGCMASLCMEVLGLNLFTGGKKSGHVCIAHGRVVG